MIVNMDNLVKLTFGTLKAYQNLETKDENTLYFTQYQVFKGSVPCSQQVVKCGSSLPDTLQNGIIYVLDNMSAKMYDGSQLIDISIGYSDEISENVLDLLPTIKAVKDYCDNSKVEFDISADAIKWKYKSDDNFKELLNLQKFKQAIIDELNTESATPIKIKLDKAKSTYFVGEDFTLSDLTVFITFSNSRTVEVTDYTVDPSGVSTTTPQAVNLTVTYKKLMPSGETVILSDTLQIRVKYPEVIKLVVTKLKTQYDLNEVLSLDDLTVTGFYDDGSSKLLNNFISNVADIDMSTEGDKELKIQYENASGQIVTNSITLSVINSILYELAEPKVFVNENRDYIDTGVQLLNDNIDWTVFVEFSGSDKNVDTGDAHCLLHCMHEEYPYPGVSFAIWTNRYGFNLYRIANGTALANNDVKTHKLVITKSGEIFNMYLDNSILANIKPKPTYGITETLVLGAYRTLEGEYGRFWNGTINKCKVWNRCLSTDDVNSWLVNTVSV